MKRLKLVSLSLALVSALSLFSLPAQAATGYRISGSVSPDICYTAGFEAQADSGFLVQLENTPYYAISDSNGNFRINDVPNGTYNLKILKNGFLTRTLSGVVISSNSINLMDVSGGGLTIWAGDVVFDNAINMADHMEQARYFNTVKGDGKYEDKCDFNKDGAINMADTISLGRHQIAAPSSYPAFVQW